MKKLFKLLFLGIIVIICGIFVRCEGGTVIKMPKGDNVVSIPQYVLKWRFSFYIKDYDCDYFNYKTDHCGTSSYITDKYTFLLKESGYRVKLKVETTYWCESDLEAVIYFKLDHKGMKEKFYRPQLEELLASYHWETPEDLYQVQSNLETELNHLWKDQLSLLKFEIIELETEKI